MEEQSKKGQRLYAKFVINVFSYFTDALLTLIFCQRFDDFFRNHLRTPSSGVGGKRDTICLTEEGGKRLEQSINCYYRLFKDSIKPLLDDAYHTHQKDCAERNVPVQAQTTFKNKFLSEKFKTESEDVRQQVLDSRQKGTDRGGDNLTWVDEESVDDVELKRRRKAHILNT